ncbi:uncharacterized protein LOC143522232 [Brachyhypopomus gauderio]|uniref:uncharacterized protein LOC143522232 n=1 Tax=Brachyhypopomus gauderio TaxID=698409 RepID=UPI00404284F1
MPRTKASRRSAAAKARFAKMRGPAVQADESPVVDAVSSEEMGPEVLAPEPRVLGSGACQRDPSPEVLLPLKKKVLTPEVLLPLKKKVLTPEVLLPLKKKVLTNSDPIVGQNVQKLCKNRAKTVQKLAYTVPMTSNTMPMTSDTCQSFPSRSINESSDAIESVCAQFSQVQTLTGSFHQGHPMFANKANKQCVANSVTAIMMSKVKNVLSWTPADLDDVLMKGDDLYRSIRDAGSIHDPSGYLFVGDLPTTHTLQNNSFDLNYSDVMFVGLFGVHDYDEMQNVYMPYDEALIRVFSQFDACLFTVNLNTCAIIKQGSCYVLIDSHSRNSQGERTKSGTSLVAYHATMESLLNHVMVLGLSLNADKMQFEITGVTATVSCTIVMPETFEGERLSLMDSTEIETTVYTGDSACSSVNASANLLYSDAVKRKHVTDVHNGSADQLAKRVSTRGNEHGDDVVLVTETQADNFKFSPLTTQQQKSMCLKLNIVYIDHNRAQLPTPAVMGEPCQTQTITGDGNCFFRSLAFAICGSEKEHRKIRCATVKHIEKNEARYVNYLREGYSCVSQYISKTRMKYVGTWATEVEIQAAADLLGVHIFTHTQNGWLKYSACHPSTGDCNNATGIFLKHCNNSHYEVVTCVRTSETTCIELCLCNYGSASFAAANRRKCDRNKRHYDTDENYREAKVKKATQRYHDDENFRNCVKKRDVYEYSTNDKYKHHKLMQSQEKYSQNEEHRKHKKQLSTQKYKTDQKHRENVKSLSVEKYKTDQEHRDNVKSFSVEKYKTDQEHRDNVKRLSVEKYKTDQEHRDNVKRLSVHKYSTDEKHKEHVKQRSVDRYKTDVHHVNRLKLQNTEKRNTRKDNRKDMSYVLEQFRDKIAMGPVHVCAVCHRALFKHQVINCRKQEYLKKAATVALLADTCITDNYLHKCNVSCSAYCPDKAGPAGCLWICYTCHRKICNGKMPEESVTNNLSLEPIPSELQMLNSLEQHLIAMHIPFMRIVSLPKGGQNGVHGPVTCVPSNMTDVVDVLPRSENIDQMIRVKLKRKLTYKGHYKYEFVCPDKIQASLMYLQKHNKFYSDVLFNNDWNNSLSKTQNAEDDVLNDQCVDEEKHDDDSENDNIDETLHDRQQHGMFMDTCLQPVDVAQEILDQHFDGILSVAPAEGNNPVRLLTDESNEAKCFPVLFPKGTGTFHDNRPERLTLCKYLNARILNADGRFAKNLDYIFYGQYLSEVNQVVSNVSIALRKGHCVHKTDITSEMLVNTDSLQRILNHDEGYKFLKPIRGTPVFWQSVQKDLFAMVRQLGIPTWFCSFSSADLRWPELMETILTQEGKHVSPDDLDWSERCALLKSNPVTAARMFDHRFRCFLKDVIMSEAQPIGEIVDYFYRIEFQQRGSPHSHCLFWVKDAPQIDKDDDNKVVAFIDHYVTCEMPSADDTEMNEVVSTVQLHSKKHSKTCKKKGTTCRFNFPRPPSSRTFLTRRKTEEHTNADQEKSAEQSIAANTTQSSPHMEHDVADSILKNVKTALLNTEANFESADDLFASLGINQETFEAAYQTIGKKNSVVLKRKPCDAWVNQYNRNLLNAWNANMDIQFVIDAYSCIVYIISYISKAEREMGLLLSHAQKEASQQGNLDAKQALRKLGSVFLHNREVSAQESVYRLTNMRLKEASRKVQFVPTCDAIRMSLPLNVIQRKAECLDKDSENIWMNSITDRYKGRPKSKDFEEMCLATFASEYRVLSKSEMSSPNTVKLDEGLGFVKKRSRTEPAVIRYARFSPTKNPAKYYESILQLFLPHYLNSQLKPPTFQTHQEFYEGGFVKYSDNELVSVKAIVDTNMSKFEKEADSIDQAQEDLEVHGPMEDAWAQICPETEQERLECLENKCNDNTNMNENSDVIPDLLPKQTFSLDNNKHNLPKDAAMALLRSLNAKQSQIFYQIRHWCLQKLRGEHPDPFHVFISGPGGVGKSVLIKAIHYEACRILSRLSQNPDETRVLLTAPTGVSAYNIDAATIHTSLSIGTDTKLPYQPLGDEKINALRTKLGKLDILIIDEISMVDHKLLAYIHGRLRQIKQCGDYSAFGKVSIIAVGDFYQLSPVKGKSLYSEPVGVNLWQNHFALAELTDIMRQKDAAFAELLNRLRKRQKCDPLLNTDINKLKQCETGEGECTTNLHIYATNEEVDDHNRRMLQLICSETTVIEAQDYDRIPKTGRFQRVKGHHGNMCNTCLSRSLHIGINARVMLLKNIDVSDGLVNGAFGTVNAIHVNAGEDFPSKIYVTFDNERAGTAVKAKNQCLQPDLQKATPIEPDEERVTKSGGIRRQFPLKLAWACTIHKVQGLTVDKAVVSLKKIFAPGQAYVALSRVTSLQGLIIQDFKESAIYAKSDIESFMQTMPAFIQPVQQTQVSPSCKILLHNVQGLSCHLQDLQQDKRYMDADIICMTETWVQSRHNSDVQISGFSFYNQPRCLSYDTTDTVFAKLKDKQHGGVGIYYKPQTNCTIVDVPCMNLECMQFILPHLNATAAIVYRPSSYNQTVFLNNLSSLIRHMDSFPQGKIIMGDFNVNLFVTKSVCEVLQHYGFTQLVKDATTENGTLIDHVYVKDLDIDKICISVMPTYFSCHECVVLYW